MWISEQMSNRTEGSAVQSGKSVLNSNGGVDIVATGVARDVRLYVPYGYEYSLPSGENALIASNGSSYAGLGVELGGSALPVGEIRITAQSGAYIHLRNDGSVIINGMKISRDGVIE